MSQPEQSEGSLNFQFSGITVVFSSGSISSFGTKTSRPADYKVAGTGSKNSASGSLGKIVNCTTLISIPLIPGPVNPGCERNRIICLTLIQSIYSLLKNLASALQGIATQLAL